MDKPRGLDKAVKAWEAFHDKKATKLNPLQTKIPEVVYVVGPMVRTDYFSTKWGEKANYTHDHDEGTPPTLYSPRMTDSTGEPRAVPAWIRDTDVCWHLGKTLDIVFINPFDGDEDKVNGVKGAHLFAIGSEDKACILIIEPKTGRLGGLIWGGRMHINERGIIA